MDICESSRHIPIVYCQQHEKGKNKKNQADFGTTSASLRSNRSSSICPEYYEAWGCDLMMKSFSKSRQTSTSKMDDVGLSSRPFSKSRSQAGQQVATSNTQEERPWKVPQTDRRPRARICRQQPPANKHTIEPLDQQKHCATFLPKAHDGAD